MVGVLRGPLFGLSDPELFRHRQAGFGFLVTAPNLAEMSGPVGEALRAMHRMYEWTRRLPAPAAVERILEATGLLATTAAGSPGGAEAGDLLHAVDRIRQVTEEGGTLADAAEALIEDLSSAEVESVPLEPGRTNVVRVMNLHKAKGLEAPGSFWPIPSAAGSIASTCASSATDRAPSATSSFAAEGGVRPDAPRATRRTGRTTRTGSVPTSRPSSAGFCTSRPRGRAISCGEPARGCGRAQPAVADARGLPRHGPGPGGLAGRGPAPAHAARPGRRGPARGRDRADARLESRRAPSWQVESVTGTAHRAGPYGHPLQEGRTREPDTGMAWGSLIHFLLEHAMRGPRRDRDHLERVAAWFAFDRPELRRVIPEALDTVERVMAAEFWHAALAAEERAVEVPFAVRVQEPGAPPRVLHGVIDLAFKTADGWTLIDYKTDQLGAGVDALDREVRAPDPRLHHPLERAARYADPRRPPLHPQRRDSMALSSGGPVGRPEAYLQKIPGAPAIRSGGFAELRFCARFPRSRVRCSSSATRSLRRGTMTSKKRKLSGALAAVAVAVPVQSFPPTTSGSRLRSCPRRRPRWWYPSPPRPRPFRPTKSRPE